MLCALVVFACTEPPETPVEGEQQPESIVTPQPQEPPGDIRAGGTLRMGLSQDPDSIDPRFITDQDGERVVGALFDPLVHLDRDGRAIPAAAESWEVLDDGARFRFTLRDATFHDGSPVTASAFERAFDRLADGTATPPSFLGYLLAPIQGASEAAERGGGLRGVHVEDPSTLIIELDEPQPGYVTTLAHPSLVPLPDAAYTDLERFAQQPIGNGPFAMSEPREPGAFLRLTAFADHHQPPLLDEVVLQVYPDDPDRLEQWEDLVGGALQVGEVLPERLPEAVSVFGPSTDGYEGPGVLNGVSSTTYLYGFDTTREPYDDPDVRRAISLAIDRERLADDIMQGTRVAADALVPPAIPGSQSRACDHCRHDPEAARALWEAVEVTLDSLTITHIGGGTHAAIAEGMASDIESALGIDVDLRAEDLQPFVTSVRRGEVPFFWLGWEADAPDPGAYLYPLFHGSQVGVDNLSGYARDEVDELIDQARAAPTAAVAVPMYRLAERRLLADAPMLPLLWHRHAVVVTHEVRDLYWSPLGRVDLSKVWLDDAS